MTTSIEDVITYLERLQGEITSMTCALHSNKNEKEVLQHQIKTLQKENSMLDEQLSTTQTSLKQLTDEIEALKKVSHIIAIERENSRLRNEISMLKTPKIATSNSKKHLETVNESELETDEEDVHVFEKTFNKVVYYVSNDSKSIIYKQNTDGTIGDRVGFCKSQGQKLIPTWDL